MLLPKTSTEMTTRPISNSKNPKACFFDIVRHNIKYLVISIQLIIF